MFVGGSGGMALLLLFVLMTFALRARRGGAWGGGGPWGGGRSRGPYGGGPYGGGPNSGGPYGGGPYGGSTSTPTSSGSPWPNQDQPLAGPGAGAPTGGAAGGYAGDWMHDDRPAAASIPADLFPGTPAPTPAAESDSPVEAGLAAIHAHDPNFNLDQFTSQVERVFFIVQQAWSERNPDLSRQVMADTLWEQHRDRIQVYIGAHKRNMLDNLNVVNVWPVAVHSDQQRDTITVRIVASCTDYDVDDVTGRVVRGDKTVRQWQEDWTFERSSAAQTQIGGTNLGSKCPNCGAPLDVDLAGTCRYCKAPIMSGQYDWVLARISQVG